MTTRNVTLAFQHMEVLCYNDLNLQSLYGNATILLEKSIALKFCEYNLLTLLLCCIHCCLPSPQADLTRGVVVLWRSADGGFPLLNPQNVCLPINSNLYVRVYAACHVSLNVGIKGTKTTTTTTTVLLAL